MSTKRFAWFFGALALIFALPSVSYAANCTAAQREAADRQLWLNQRDRDLASEIVFPWGAPVATNTSNQRRLVQRDYVIEYDDDLQGPIWAANVLGLKILEGGRIDCFRQDPRIPGPVSARPSDYDEAIFDQGHMVPNADMTFGQIPIINTFIMSNMSPQFCQFNRGIWQILETFERHWAEDGTPVYIFNGAVFDRNGDGLRDRDDESVRMRSRNGRTNVAVPSAYFKVLAREGSDGRLHTLTILLPHDQTDVDGQVAVDYLGTHITTVAAVERLTGSDFFPSASSGLAEGTALWDVSDASFRSLVAAPCRRTAGAVIAEGSPRVFVLP